VFRIYRETLSRFHAPFHGVFAATVYVPSISIKITPVVVGLFVLFVPAAPFWVSLLTRFPRLLGTGQWS
jgi:hypothetical protein